MFKTKFQPVLKMGWRLMSALGRGLWCFLASKTVPSAPKITCLVILALGLVVAPIVYFANAQDTGNALTINLVVNALEGDQSKISDFKYNIEPKLVTSRGKHYLGFNLNTQYLCSRNLFTPSFPFSFNKAARRFELSVPIPCSTPKPQPGLLKYLQVYFLNRSGNSVDPSNPKLTATSLILSKPSIKNLEIASPKLLGFHSDDYSLDSIELRQISAEEFYLAFLVSPKKAGSAIQPLPGGPEDKTTAIAGDAKASRKLASDPKTADPKDPGKSRPKPHYVSPEKTPAADPPKPKPKTALPPKGYQAKSGMLNLWWAQHERSTAKDYKRLHVWFGRRDKHGVWRYTKQTDEKLRTGLWTNLPGNSIKDKGTRLVISGCKVWDKNRNICTSEETIPISDSRSSHKKPGDYVLLDPAKLPAEIVLDLQYYPPARPEDKAPKAEPAPAADQKGYLTVSASLEDVQTTSQNPIWVYVKIYDRRGRKISVLSSQVNARGNALFPYSKLDGNAHSARLLAFWPFARAETGFETERERGSEQGENIRYIYYRPAFSESFPIAKLRKRKTFSLTLRRLRVYGDEGTLYNEEDNGIHALLKGMGMMATEPGEGVLQGNYDILIPISDQQGRGLPGLMCMLILVDRQGNPLYGYATRSNETDRGYICAVFPRDIFNRDVTGALLFVYSEDYPGGYIPVVVQLDTRTASISEEPNLLSGIQYSARLQAVPIELNRGWSVGAGRRPAAAAAPRPAPAKPRPLYTHPRRGVLNAIMIDQKTRLPLGGVAAYLQADGKNKALVTTSEDGQVCIPLLEKGTLALKVYKKGYEIKSPRRAIKPRQGFFEVDFKQKKIKYFVSLELKDKKTGRRLGETDGKVTATAWEGGANIAKGVYNGNGYVNFKELEVSQLADGKKVTLKVSFPNYGSGQQSFVVDKNKDSEALELVLSPATRGLMVLINNAKNWREYPAARNQLRISLLKFIKSGNAAAKDEKGYHTLIYSALNGNLAAMDLAQLKNVEKDASSLKALLRRILGTSNTEPYATLKGLNRITHDFGEELKTAGGWDLILILAFNPDLIMGGGGVDKVAQKLTGEMNQELKNQNIRLYVLDVSTGDAPLPREHLENLCRQSKGRYIPLARGDVKTLADKMAELGVK